MIVLCYNCHTCYHQNNGGYKQQILDRKRDFIIKTLTQYGLNALKIAKRKNSVVALPFLVYHLIDLGYLQEGDVISWFGIGGKSEEGKSGPLLYHFIEYHITEKGEKLIKDWF